MMFAESRRAAKATCGAFPRALMHVFISLSSSHVFLRGFYVVLCVRCVFFYFILSGVVGDRRTGDYRSSLLVPPYLYGSVSVKQKKLPSNTKKIYSSACCG